MTCHVTLSITATKFRQRISYLGWALPSVNFDQKSNVSNFLWVVVAPMSLSLLQSFSKKQMTSHT